MTQPNREPLATSQQVSDYLGVPVKTLSQWRWRGDGPPFIKVGAQHVRYRWADIESWVREQTSVGVA